MVLGSCEHCGIGEKAADGACSWCGRCSAGSGPLLFPWRDRFWERFVNLPGIQAASHGGPAALGAAAGVYAGLLLALVTFLTPLGALATAGFFLDSQWWFYLLPDELRHPAAAVTRGGLLGMMAAIWVPGQAPRHAGRPRLSVVASGAILAAVLIGVLTAIEGTSLEGLALGAAGGAFTGGAVDQARRRWQSRDPGHPADGDGTSSGHSR
jgi:hypothetical protein